MPLPSEIDVAYEVGSIIRRAQVGDRPALPAGGGRTPLPNVAVTPLTEPHSDSARQPNFRDYLRILKRRRLALVLTTIVVTAGAVAFSLHQQTLYQATAQVLINRQDIAAAITNTPENPALSEDPARYAATESSIARSTSVAELTLARAAAGALTVKSLLAHSSVNPNPTADTLTFEVRNPSSATAVRLVNAYAAAFAAYKLQLDTAELQSARNNLNSQIAALRAAKNVSGAQYQNLVTSQQRLHTMQLLQARDTVLSHPTKGVQVQPQPKRNGLLGLGFGLVLGIGLAFALDALDRRIRSDDEVEETLELPLLARLPKPPHQRDRARLSMIEEPRSVYSDSVRRLATSISFVNPDSPAQVLMITSSVQREGKSTTIANLAVALARAGHKVALVDLDLRQPTLARLFGIHRLTGLTDVAIRRATLDAALVPIGVAASGPTRAPADAAHTSQRGSLSVLPTGPLPASPSEFVGSEALATRVLEPLRERFEYVLIDAPPICVVADTSVLTARVDGVLAVTRLGVVERPALRDLKRELAASPAPAIGIVVTDAEVISAYGYGTYFTDETPPSVRSENGDRAGAAAGRGAQRTRTRSGSRSG